MVMKQALIVAARVSAISDVQLEAHVQQTLTA
jgi:hypothetical protein